MVRRFDPKTRLLHAAAIVCFLGLGGTGAAMCFDDQRWASEAIRVLGGMPAVGRVHHIFAVTALAVLALHLALAARSARRRRAGRPLGPDSIVPRLSDLRDLAAHVRWFVRGGARPVWSRWAYWEKLQYWTVLAIMVVAGVTGTILWFPTQASRVLPGWMINLAAVLHSEEALLAAGLVIAAHIAHAFIRRGRAALDQAMFTGLVAEEDYRRERPAEWARLEARGLAEGLRRPAPSGRKARLVTGLGIAAALAGIGLLGLTLLATLSR